MKLLFFTFLFLSFAAQGQYETKVASMDSIINNLYDVISGEKGEQRDWTLFSYLFTPSAQLIPARMNRDSLFRTSPLSAEDYIRNAGPYLEANGFFEKEIHRAAHCFGNICQVFSTYETYRSANDIVPMARGINSIQLLFDNNRWWIVNVYWQEEDEKHPIPPDFLPK